LTKAEREALEAEITRKANREKETEEQKWFRGAISEAVEEKLTELLGLGDDDEDEDEGKKQSGSGLDFADFLGFGKRKTG
jgi:hypothetical protein